VCSQIFDATMPRSSMLATCRISTAGRTQHSGLDPRRW
jgi:hypothetical protein